MTYSSLEIYLETIVQRTLDIPISVDYGIDFNEWQTSYSTIVPAGLIVFDDMNYSESYEDQDVVLAQNVRIILNLYKDSENLKTISSLLKDFTDFSTVSERYLLLSIRGRWIPTDKSKQAFEINLVYGC